MPAFGALWAILHANGLTLPASARRCQVWDAENLTCLATLSGHTGPVRTLARCGDKVFSGSYDKTVRWRGAGAAAGAGGVVLALSLVLVACCCYRAACAHAHAEPARLHAHSPASLPAPRCPCRCACGTCTRTAAWPRWWATTALCAP